jgi:2-polyprenyl-6-methoxyphenol hydroxylase-like FAD-dependent oxidoreductase
MTERLRQGRIFLAGDAAHIHSPVGGQGMNTGIQDALNLAYRVAKVLRGADESELNGYEADRLPVARTILRATDLVTRLGILPNRGLPVFLRETVLPYVLRSHRIRDRVLTALSQVRTARAEIGERQGSWPEGTLAEA